MKKVKQVNCNCAAYDFPHRLDSGECKTFYNNEFITDSYKAGIARDFERTEAQAYNREMSIFEQVRGLS